MKKVLLLLVGLVPFLGHSQFILTKEGMVDEYNRQNEKYEKTK